MPFSIPYIDTNVEHVGVSKLRTLSAKSLKEIGKAWVLQENDTPLAVLLQYEQYLIMQRQLMALIDTIEVLSDQEESKALFKGLADVKEGKVTELSQIKAAMRQKLRG